MEPELYLRRFYFKARCVRRFRGNVVPVAGSIAGFLAVHDQNQHALGDHSHISGLVIVGRDSRAGWIRGEQHVAVLRLQLEGVERAFERRKVAK